METLGPRSQERILNKALELFSLKGYDATSVREICEAAEITKPTLYHFYGSKEGVYRALVDGALEDFRIGVVAALETPGTIEDRLKRMAWAYFDAAIRHRQRTRFIFGLIHDPPNSAPATDFHHFYGEVVARVAQAVQQGVDRGELAPGPGGPRLLVFMGSLGEAVCGCLLAGEPELTPALADTIVETILGGWRQQP